MDACFSGISRNSETFKKENLLAMKGVVIKPDVLNPWENDPNFTVFTSSDYNETSLIFDDSETGLFTYYLCAGLKGLADTDNNKKITTQELKDYVIRNVKETSKRMVGEQNPKFYGNEENVLVKY